MGREAVLADLVKTVLPPERRNGRLGRRRAWLALTVAAAVGLLVSCSDAGPAPSARAPAAPATGPTPTDIGVCREFLSSVGSARAPVDAMRTEAVLSPFIALIELSPRQTAERGTSATDPAVADAMRAVMAAIDDLDAQAKARLPAGADPTVTTVRLDPNRLATALDSAERVCNAQIARMPTASPTATGQLSR
jgi:hypothetical protein